MEKTLENSGGRVSYYLVRVDHPQREDQPAYTAECEDIIEALQLPFDEANIFKEIWRTANECIHGVGKEGNTQLRAAQKMVHYSGRILRRAKRITSNKQTKVLKEWYPRTSPPTNDDTDVEVVFTDVSRTTRRAGSVLWEDIAIARWRYIK